MIDIDITMAIHIINMLVLIVIMNIVLYKPVRTILEERQEKIGELEKEIDNFKKNTRLRLEEFDRKLDSARKQGKEALDNVRQEAATVSGTTVNTVRDEMMSMKTERFSHIHEEFEAARKELKGQVESFASEMVGKILGRAI